MPSRWQMYCWRRRDPQPLCRRLNDTAPLAWVAEYSLTGIETSPNDSVSEAIARAVMSPVVPSVLVAAVGRRFARARLGSAAACRGGLGRIGGLRRAVSGAPPCLRLGGQRFLARHQLQAERIEVDLGPAREREELAFLLAHVMLHVLAQHLDLGVVEQVVGRRGFELLDEHAHHVMLDRGLVDEIGDIVDVL